MPIRSRDLDSTSMPRLLVLVALGLVRDYIKNCSASSVVINVSLDDGTKNRSGIEKHLQLSGNQLNTEFITVHTKDTKYHFRIKKDSQVIPPTL